MREWRGFKDTMVDYYHWLVNWKDLILFVFMANPVTVIKALFKYRWFYGYLHFHDLVDRCTAGERGINLKTSHIYVSGLFKHFSRVLLYSMLCRGDECVLMEEFMPASIVKAMGLRHNPVASVPLLFATFIDQNLPLYYLDAAENYGVSSDTCSLPSSTAGLAIADDLIKDGAFCAVVSNIPCDGGMKASHIIEKRMDMPTHIVEVPLRYDEPWAKDFMVHELKGMIKFLEEQSGRKLDWDKLKEICEMHNKHAEYELERWEINRTDYPQKTGSVPWLWRAYCYQLAPSHPILIKAEEKASKLIRKGYKNKKVSIQNPRYRAVVWGAYANFDAGFARWLENAWGICVLIDFERYTSVDLIDTSTRETMLKGIAKHYVEGTMIKHTKGSSRTFREELWQICEDFRIDVVILDRQIGCKSLEAVSTILEEEAQKRNIKMCTVFNDIMDCRTFSRQDRRDAVNKFMFSVMNATPVDESLLEIDDHQGKSW